MFTVSKVKKVGIFNLFINKLGIISNNNKKTEQ